MLCACRRPGSSTSKCLRCYYIGLMDALYPICPDCLFIGEGTGATALAANWGKITVHPTLHCSTPLHHLDLDAHHRLQLWNSATPGQPLNVKDFWGSPIATVYVMPLCNAAVW